MHTVIGVFKSLPQAERAAHDLMQAGISSQSISVLAGNDAAKHDEYLRKIKDMSRSAGAVAASSASVGAGVGLLASLTMIVIPGVGPIIAGGALATLLTGAGVGATFGGLIGAFHQMGLPHEKAPLYEEAIRRGAVIVFAEVDAEREKEAVQILANHGAIDLRDVADPWNSIPWSGPSVDPHPYPSDPDVRSHEMTGDADAELQR
jgi:hypothetical protein